MRLGQLARQLNIKTDKIVSFLAKEKNLTIKSHPNAKVDDELIDEIITHFKPTIVVDEPVTIKKKEIKSPLKEDKIISGNTSSETKIEEAQTDVQEKLTTLKSSFTAPKIIGKIDLPDKSKIDVEIDGVVYDQETLEKKQKEEREAKKIAAAKEKALQKEKELAKELTKQKREAEKKRSEELKLALAHHDTHNVLTKKEEQQQKLKEQNRLKREEEIKKKQKLKRAENYKKNHAATNNLKKNKTKKSKKIKQVEKPKITEKIVVEDSIETTVVVPKEKNIFKRFLKWLNTE